MPPPATSYDDVVYPGHAFPETHPANLGAIGILHGMDPAPVDRCRVLELGCGDGANLVPMAYTLPEASFVGIDLAAAPVARGQAFARALGLRNLELHVLDVMDLATDVGKFDYVIAHGLYSWVPEPVRNRVLELCGEVLAPQGIAFVSYLAEPGNRLRSILRDFVLLRDVPDRPPDERIARARESMRMFSAGPQSSEPFQQFARALAAEFADLADGAIFHDWLAPLNVPLSITEFVQLASRHGLAFLGEAEFFMMRYEHDPTLAAAREELSQLESQDRVAKEQRLDYLRARRFRQTLLSRTGVELTPLEPLRLRRLAASSRLTLQDGARLTDRSEAVFRSPRGTAIRIDHPVAKAALAILGEASPQAIAFDTLLAAARHRSEQGRAADPERDEQIMASVLLSLAGASHVELRSAAHAFVIRPGARPRASAVARFQARRQRLVTTLTHGTLEIGDTLGRALLELLDGTRDRDQLLAELERLVTTGAVDLPVEGASVRDVLAMGLERSLEGLARSALLEA